MAESTIDLLTWLGKEAPQLLQEHVVREMLLQHIGSANTDPDGEPRLALDADGFLRAALLGEGRFNPYDHCHRPVVVRDESRSLGWVIQRLAEGGARSPSGVVEKDVVLVWGKSRRIITGADILGRLLEGI